MVRRMRKLAHHHRGGKDNDAAIGDNGLEIVSSFSTEFKIIQSLTDSSFELEPIAKIVYLPPSGRGCGDEERKRLVRFSLDHSIYPILDRRDIPKEQRREIWYRASELKRMRTTSTSSSTLAERVDEDGDNDGVIDEKAGDIVSQSTTQKLPPVKDGFLECERALHKLMAVSVVLEEQTRQKQAKGSVDPIKISRVYQQFVLRARNSVFVSQLARERKVSEEKRRGSSFNP